MIDGRKTCVAKCPKETYYTDNYKKKCIKKKKTQKIKISQEKVHNYCIP